MRNPNKPWSYEKLSQQNYITWEIMKKIRVYREINGYIVKNNHIPRDYVNLSLKI